MGEADGDFLRQERFARWRGNAIAMKESVRERFRVTSLQQRFLRRSQRLQPGGVGWRATAATGLVAARVFHGNVVLARVARSMAKDRWQKRIGKLGEFLPTFRTLAASVTAGSLAYAESAQAEALALSSASYHHLGFAGCVDQEVSLTLRRHSSGQKAMIMEPDSTVTETKELDIFRDDSAFMKIIQAVAVPLIGNASHVVMHGFNSTEVYGAEKMQHAVLQRPAGQPLITVCNHTAAVDDPFVLSSVLPPRHLLNASNMRWTLCASDKCFSSRATAAFFRSVKVLPLTKGHGVFQEGMEMALTKLNRGEWVHIFPEGSRSRDGKMDLFKRGVGRLVLDAEMVPIVLPFVHTGMERVMPIGQKHFSTGQNVTVLIGDPILVDDLVKKHVKEGISKAVLYDAITLRIEGAMWRMRKDLDDLVGMREVLARQRGQGEVLRTERAQGIWQYADWEAQGVCLDELNCRSSAGQTPNVGDDSQQPNAGSTRAARDLDAGRVDGQYYPGSWSESGLTDIYNGALNRIQAHSDPSMFMGFAARGLLATRARFDHGLEDLSRRCWRRITFSDIALLDEPPL